MQMDLGKTGLQPPQEVFVELHAEIGMDAALEKDPGPAGGDGLGHLVGDLRELENIGVAGILGPVKGTEPTAIDTHIRVVDVAVDDVGGDTLLGLPPSHGIRRLTEFEERTPIEEQLDLRSIQPFARHRFVENL